MGQNQSHDLGMHPKSANYIILQNSGGVTDIHGLVKAYGANIVKANIYIAYYMLISDGVNAVEDLVEYLKKSEYPGGKTPKSLLGTELGYKILNKLMRISDTKCVFCHDACATTASFSKTTNSLVYVIGKDQSPSVRALLLKFV
ncbi:hypothetical protein BB561_005049 [Smittium simulii]|uniref:Uncharacterized protein n=1 Tax=Smittium simulii TaxID=133385 RepID=A0A2T9YCJ2_9FUNG|nr:hypothetical protein BB561_005049 [Smittium simulii]